MGSDIPPELIHVNLEDSFLYGVLAEADDLTFIADFALFKSHALYQQHLADAARCWRKGKLIFKKVRNLKSKANGLAFTTQDLDGSVDFGMMWMTVVGGQYSFHTDFAEFTFECSAIEVVL